MKQLELFQIPIGVVVEVPYDKLIAFQEGVMADDDNHSDLFYCDLCRLFWRALLNAQSK